MKALFGKRCTVGEGPIWNVPEQKLYVTNVRENEICIYDLKSDNINVRKLPLDIFAMAFDTQNRLIVSHDGGVHILNDDNSLRSIYNDSKHQILYANDMKVGPDGAIYVGTQSERRKGISDNVNGKLYRISPDGCVTVLLDGLGLSNGMEWSFDETKFYHADTDMKTLKEYDFDSATGEISFTGRKLTIEGVDGFTVGQDGCLYVGCWGQRHVAVVDTDSFEIKEYMETEAKVPTSCCFCGEDMDILAITTATRTSDILKDTNAGFTLLKKINVKGRKPYLFLGK